MDADKKEKAGSPYRMDAGAVKARSGAAIFQSIMKIPDAEILRGYSGPVLDIRCRLREN